MYRKGIYGHCEMLRVNLREAFPAGIVSGKKEANGRRFNLTIQQYMRDASFFLRTKLK